MKLEAAFSKTTNATSTERDDSNNESSYSSLSADVAVVVLLKAAFWQDIVFIDLIVIFREKSL